MISTSNLSASGSSKNVFPLFFCQIHIKPFSLLSCFLHLPQTDLLSYFVEFSLHRSSSSPCLCHPTAESLACFHRHQTLPQAIVLHPFVGIFKIFRATSQARNPSVLEKMHIHCQDASAVHVNWWNMEQILAGNIKSAQSQSKTETKTCVLQGMCTLAHKHKGADVQAEY